MPQLREFGEYYKAIEVNTNEIVIGKLMPWVPKEGNRNGICLLKDDGKVSIVADSSTEHLPNYKPIK